MTVEDLKKLNAFTLLNDGGNATSVITKPYCCDLLSIAMGNVPADSAWVTVMGNMNTLAVASLKPDETMLQRATREDITVFTTDLPVFEAALEVYRCIE